MPDNYPIPKWSKDPMRTKKFQDWVNGLYPGAINTTGGVGKFGPRTTKAWNQYGKQFDMFSDLEINTNEDIKAGANVSAFQGITPGAALADIPKGIPQKPARDYMVPADFASGTGDGSLAPKKGKLLGAMAKGAHAIAPFASNIVNAFRKPPMPKMGIPDSYTGLNKVNLSNERYAVSTNINAANRATERNVDGNTAEAIKLFNKGEEFSRLSAINERESTTNTAISNEQARMDAQVGAANVGKVNKYQDELVERDVAHQREQSANWANAGDKAMMIRNEQSKERTEYAKARVLRTMFDKSGVLKRNNAMGKMWKDSGIPDPFGENYKWLDKEDKDMSYGGMMKVPLKKVI